MTDKQPADLVELATWAEARLPELTESACAAIVARVPFYQGGTVVPIADLRRSVGHNLRFLVHALRAPGEPRDLTAPRDTGRRRAQQSAPLPEVLQAYRICFGTLWDALVEHARVDQGAADADALLAAATLMWQFTDEHALAVTESYRAATAEILLARQRRRGALVEALLTGQPGPDGGPWEAASLLGLPPGAQLIVVAAETRSLAEESLSGIERLLTDRGVVSAWRLTPALQLGLVAITAGQQELVLSTLREAVTARTGASPPYPSLSDTPRALLLARTALAAVPLGRAELRLFDPSPLAALVAIDPGEGSRITQAVLGTVLALPADDRDILLETLTSYLNHDGSAERAGRVLHCHPNTVRYRLRRLQELTGRSLSDPNDAAELAAASYAVQMRPESVVPGRHVHDHH